MSNTNNTPLRYPGGKSIFTDFFTSYIEVNKISDAVYVEPYCGGAGAAINLLLNDTVKQIWLNDANYSIYSFWYSLKYYGEEFLNRFDEIEINIDNWIIQRRILNNTEGKTDKKEDVLSNGFATFYLNRCNRSGILKAGAIGGNSRESQLSANYKIDARFNKKNLRTKLEAIISKNDRIVVSNMDALYFLSELSKESIEIQKKIMVYLDPPYYKQGSSLYLNFYEHDDHKSIAEFLKNEFNWKWLLSYDNVKDIRKMYSSFSQYSFYLNYSAQDAKLGNELLIHSNNSLLPESMLIKQIKHTKKKIELVLI